MSQIKQKQKTANIFPSNKQYDLFSPCGNLIFYLHAMPIDRGGVEILMVSIFMPLGGHGLSIE